MGDRRTHITWLDSFKLREDKFPGNFGAIGRFLFRVRFLDKDYAALMRDIEPLQDRCGTKARR
jgi:hypothetical protein